MKRKHYDFKNYSFNVRNHFCLLMLLRLLKGFTLAKLSSEFPLTTFSLVKTSFLTHFQSASCYLSKSSYFYFGHYFSLQNCKSFRETQNPNGSFLLPSLVLCWSSANEVQLEIPEPFKSLELGCALLSFLWMCILAFKKHARHGNHVEHKRLFCCI